MNWSHFALWDLNKIGSSPHLLFYRKWNSPLHDFCGVSEVFVSLLTSASWLAWAHLRPPPVGLFLAALYDPEMKHSPFLLTSQSPKHHFTDCLKLGLHRSSVNMWWLNNKCPCPEMPLSHPEFLTDPLSLWVLSSRHPCPNIPQTFPHGSASQCPTVPSTCLRGSSVPPPNLLSRAS